LGLFRKSVEKVQFFLESKKTKVTLHKEHSTFFIISRSVCLRMRKV